MNLAQSWGRHQNIFLAWSLCACPTSNCLKPPCPNQGSFCVSPKAPCPRPQTAMSQSQATQDHFILGLMSPAFPKLQATLFWRLSNLGSIPFLRCGPIQPCVGPQTTVSWPLLSQFVQCNWRVPYTSIVFPPLIGMPSVQGKGLGWRYSQNKEPTRR